MSQTRQLAGNEIISGEHVGCKVLAMRLLTLGYRPSDAYTTCMAQRHAVGHAIRIKIIKGDPVYKLVYGLTGM